MESKSPDSCVRPRVTCRRACVRRCTPGPTGTGKTVNIVQHLQTGVSDAFVPLCLTFSAQTSANQTQVKHSRSLLLRQTYEYLAWEVRRTTHDFYTLGDEIKFAVTRM